MKNNPDLPPGWAMPDNQANKLKEKLNRKATSPVDELEKAMKDFARDIAILEPEPLDSEGWVSILLGHLEEESQRRRIHDSYCEMVISMGRRLSRNEN